MCQCCVHILFPLPSSGQKSLTAGLTGKMIIISVYHKKTILICLLQELFPYCLHCAMVSPFNISGCIRALQVMLQINKQGCFKVILDFYMILHHCDEVPSMCWVSQKIQSNLTAVCLNSILDDFA